MSIRLPLDKLAEQALARYQALRESANGEHPQIDAATVEELVSAVHALQLELKQLKAQNDELVSREVALIKDRDALQHLFDAAPEGYIVTDVNAVIRRTNRIGAKLLGGHPRRLIGKPLSLFLPLNFRPRFRKLVRQMAKDATPQTIETILMTRQGQRSDVLLRVAADGDETGRLVWIVHDAKADDTARDALVTDAAERRRIDESLRRIDIRYRSLVEHATDFVYELDQNGCFTFCNEHGVHAALGYAERELLGRPLVQFVPEHARDGMHFYLKKLFAQPGQTSYYEFPMLAKKGDEVRFGQHGRSVLRADNNPGIHALCRDITPVANRMSELQSKGAQWRELTAHLQESVEAERRRIAQDIHDELGSTLTALRMEVALPPIGGTDVDAYRRRDTVLLQRIDAAIEAKRRILTGLRPSLLDNMGLCAAIEWLAQDAEQRTGIRCKLKLEGFDIEPDPDRATALYRIVQEAATNVMRHAGATQMTFTQAVRNDDAVIEIIDNGRGIKRSELTNRKAFGIVGMRERAHAFGGEVEIVGGKRGTRVTVRVPLGGE